MTGAKGPLTVEIRRGDSVESQHTVDAVVMDSAGKTILAYGDVDSLVFPRSAIKMIQALALMESGAAEAFHLSDKQIALACASHLGEKMHTETVQQWLAAIGLPESALECGPHYPFDESTQFAMIRADQKPAGIHNNCSGKHCGMLTTARYLKEDPKGYIEYDHPVQKRLRRLLGELAALDYDRASWGVDGCGIPTYAIPLQAIARSMAVLLPDSRLAGNDLRRQAAKRILSAVRQEPLMISGNEGLCSQVVRISQGRAIAKTGAEGVYTALIPEKGIAIASKVRDGAGRASELAALHLLRGQGGLNGDEVKLLQPFTDAVIKNWAGKIVGEIRVQEVGR